MTTATKKPPIQTEPRILNSTLTGRWYVLTRYRITGQGMDGGDLIEAIKKFDVTDDIEKIIEAHGGTP